MDPTYTTYSFDNGTTTVIVNPSMEGGEYLFHEGNLAAEMLMAVCQESNFGIPIRIDIPEDALQVGQQQDIVGMEQEEPQIHTLDLNLIEAEEAEVEPAVVPLAAPSSSKNLPNDASGLRKRRSKPPDPYYDLLSQIRRDTNRVHLSFQRQGDRICRLIHELTEEIKNQNMQI